MIARIHILTSSQRRVTTRVAFATATAVTVVAMAVNGAGDSGSKTGAYFTSQATRSGNSLTAASLVRSRTRLRDATATGLPPSAGTLRQASPGRPVTT